MHIYSLIIILRCAFLWLSFLLLFFEFFNLFSRTNYNIGVQYFAIMAVIRGYILMDLCHLIYLKTALVITIVLNDCIWQSTNTIVSNQLCSERRLLIAQKWRSVVQEPNLIKTIRILIFIYIEAIVAIRTMFFHYVHIARNYYIATTFF
jgi:hypothetical protein